MKNIMCLKGVKMLSIVNTRDIVLEGAIGSLKKKFLGADLIFFNNKFFFLSKISVTNFLKYLQNSYFGLINGYFVEINFIGLGSRFLKFKNYLLLKLGYGHYIKYIIPQSIVVVGYKRTLIIYGLDLQEVTVLAKKIRSFKKPDIYKGKGIQLEGEVINFKVGKQK